MSVGTLLLSAASDDSRLVRDCAPNHDASRLTSVESAFDGSVNSVVGRFDRQVVDDSPW